MQDDEVVDIKLLLDVAIEDDILEVVTDDITPLELVGMVKMQLLVEAEAEDDEYIVLVTELDETELDD